MSSGNIAPHYTARGRWTMDDGRWTMDEGRWTMDDGRWTMDDGRWRRYWRLPVLEQQDTSTPLPPVILSAAKDLKKVSRDAVQHRGL
ncbi:MAG TPA: AraC family transcriptional regulator [Chloroflexia bacterium]